VCESTFDGNILKSVSKTMFIKFVVKTAMLLISDRPKGNYKRELKSILIIQ